MLPICPCLAHRSLSPDSGVAAILSSLTQSPGLLYQSSSKPLSLHSSQVMSPCTLTAPDRSPYALLRPRAFICSKVFRGPYLPLSVNFTPLFGSLHFLAIRCQSASFCTLGHYPDHPPSIHPLPLSIQRQNITQKLRGHPLTLLHHRFLLPSLFFTP